MGYLLRGLRIASYLATALGLLLILGAIINNALFFSGIRFLFIGVVGIGATSLLRDSFLEGEEEEEYNSLLPTPQLKTPRVKLPNVNIPKVRTPKVKIPKAIRSILTRWRALSPEKKGLILIGIFGIPCFLLTIWCCVVLFTF